KSRIRYLILKYTLHGERDIFHRKRDDHPIFSTITRTRSPALNWCPLGRSMLNQRAPGLSWVRSWDIRQSFCSLISATNSMDDSNSVFGIIKEGGDNKKIYRARGVTIHVVLFE